MKLLETQAEFESYWFYTDGVRPECMRAIDNGFLIYFTADWCKHCKKLDMDALNRAASIRGLTLLKCDESVNGYTPGYCQIRSFPTFVFFTPKKIVASLKSSVTHDVESWIIAL
jgi:thiol-disulfide isomerase/thioredoxin